MSYGLLPSGFLTIYSTLIIHCLFYHSTYKTNSDSNKHSLSTYLHILSFSWLHKYPTLKQDTWG